MELSICIVTYNSAAVLPRCLGSLREHRPPVDSEVLVVDNASGDGSADLAAELYPSAIVLRNRANRGFAAACNQAVARSSGDFILLLNPDTELSRRALERMVAHVKPRPWIGACGPMLVGPDREVELSCHDLPDLRTAAWGCLGLAQFFPGSRAFGRYDMTWWDHTEARRVGWVSGAVLLISRGAWEKVGPLDERFFMYFEDADWQMRMKKAGFECWYLPEARMLHHEGRSWGDSTDDPRRALMAHASAFIFYRKHWGPGGELAVRVLTGLGALGRAFGWLFFWLGRGARPQDAGRLLLHLKVAALAGGLVRPGAPRAASGTNTPPG